MTMCFYETESLATRLECKSLFKAKFINMDIVMIFYIFSSSMYPSPTYSISAGVRSYELEKMIITALWIHFMFECYKNVLKKIFYM